VAPRTSRGRATASFCRGGAAGDGRTSKGAAGRGQCGGGTAVRGGTNTQCRGEPVPLNCRGGRDR
jgi:hypothetical protein